MYTEKVKKSCEWGWMHFQVEGDMPGVVQMLRVGAELEALCDPLAPLNFEFGWCCL